MIKHNNKKGFSLIELMIVVAIIGILAAIGIPAYNDYLLRSKVADIISNASFIKQSFSEYRSTNNSFELTETTPSGRLQEIGVSSTLPSNVSKIDVSGDQNTGTIHLCVNAEELKLNENEQLYVYFVGTSNGNGIAWSCQYSGGESSDSSKYVPATCRTLFTGTSLCP